MPFSFSAKITGVNDLRFLLGAYKQGVQNRIVRPALTKGARLIVAEAKRRAPVRTGALRASLTSVIRTGKKGVYAVVGPETSTQKVRKTGKRVRSKLGRWLDKRNIEGVEPAYYAHLVELGHQGPHPAPAHPFLRPALEAVKGAVAKVIRETVWAGIRKFATVRKARAA